MCVGGVGGKDREKMVGLPFCGFEEPTFNIKTR